MSTRVLSNTWASTGTTYDAPSREPLAFHARLPGYAPTPLASLPGMAQRLGLRDVWLKNEAARFGLPSFKVLGASWAIYRALCERASGTLGEWRTIDELREQCNALHPLRLVAATDGNHGRAVARMAQWLALPAHVFVPAGTADSRIASIEAEGATVDIVDGTYDATVERAAAEQNDRTVLVQDHAWDGYEAIPRWITEGYATMFWEADEQLAQRGADGPDLVLVQIGVGALAAAVVQHYRRRDLDVRPHLVGVEPTGAACVFESIEAGRLITVPAGADSSIMAGLNCGTPSTIAWDMLYDSLDVCMTVDDRTTCSAMRVLAGDGIVSGESGAAGAAGLVELMTNPTAEDAKEMMGLGRDSRVLVISTEGATDPVAYRDIVGQAPEAVAS